MTRDFIAKIQKALADANFDPGTIDGIMGRQTRSAIIGFQRAKNLTPDGLVGPNTRKALFGAAGAAVTSKLTIPPELPWLLEAWHLHGVREFKGKKHNATILNWASDLEIAYNKDETPWCGLFVGHCIGSTLPDDSLPANILGARQWLKFGRDVKPQFGSVLVFWRGKKSGWTGHVGFYWGEDDSCYHVLGGNQRDMVCVSRIAKNRLLGARWPKKLPELGITRTANAAGVLKTTNEG
jgi:uncharacterized protein (TIGR02594 family)